MSRFALTSSALHYRCLCAPNGAKQEEPAIELHVGARVRVKASVSKPRYGWGSVTASSIGTVKKIMRGNVTIGETVRQFESINFSAVCD